MAEITTPDTPEVPQEVPRPAEEAEIENEDDLHDIFEEEDEDDDLDYDDLGGSTAKSYNRQTANGPAGAALAARSSRPAANTRASVDDQISALSKHAAKIRLDDVKQTQDRDKDKADRATSELVLDQRTRMILLQMINRGVVSEIHGAISTGKEANVYGAVLHPEDGSEPVQRAIKVYKTAILVFKDRERYITGEHRFKSGADKGNSRKMVKLWAEKEFRNLRRIHAAGIPCPEPISLKLHVMAMEFLGDKKGWAYPRLRDAGVNSDEEWRDLYLQLLGIMRRLYQVCRLVHADLSEYNILYHNQRLYIIDVSQSVEHDHPRSLEFLRMDIKNVGDFFRRQGVDTLADRAIFDFITASEGPVEEAEMKTALEHLYEVRESVGDNEQALADIEVDNEVFRNQYIPQTLEQVYDVEADGQKIGAGHGDSLVYRNLLADQVVLPNTKGDDQEDEGSDGSEDDSDDGVSLDGSDSGKADGQPRGKRFQDKDEKKVNLQRAPSDYINACSPANFTHSNTSKPSRRPSARRGRTRCQSISRRNWSHRHLGRRNRYSSSSGARSPQGQALFFPSPKL